MKLIALKSYSLILMLASILIANPLNASIKEPTLNAEETAHQLIHLVQWEIDNKLLLEQAFLLLKNEKYKKKIEDIDPLVDKNIQILTQTAEEYIKEVPRYSKDFKGVFMEGYIAMRGLPSDKEIWKALHTNIELSLKAVEKVRKLNLPEKAREAIEKVYQNKKQAVRKIHFLL
ncbi:MAG: hypothetical protein JWM09_807 [Francisellaceae bacterium]|nr:hypothetical protein [Francisellaceae bacterium]